MKYLAILFIVVCVASCVDASYPGYPGGYPSYPTYPSDSGYRDCSYYGTCGDYDRRNDRYDYDYRQDRDHRRRDYDDRRDYDRRDRDRHDRDRDRDRRDNRRNNGIPNVSVPTPPKPPEPPVIRPNCPAGTQYTGRTCKIIDNRLRKPGGDGNINPCPKGMWVSGDRCVGH